MEKIKCRCIGVVTRVIEQVKKKKRNLHMGALCLNIPDMLS